MLYLGPIQVMGLLSDNEINNELKNLNGWIYKENSIHKKFIFLNFKTAMAVMISISYEAESMNHHPNWSNVYNQLDISLSTHDSGGVTQNDIALALKIETIAKKHL
jgi:4a-hydroxytetrahydrobiopterin dehydratase